MRSLFISPDAVISNAGPAAALKAFKCPQSSATDCGELADGDAEAVADRLGCCSLPHAEAATSKIMKVGKILFLTPVSL